MSSTLARTPRLGARAVSARLGRGPRVRLRARLSTTIVTYTIDVGISAVACILAGVQVLRRKSLGYLLFATLNIMLALVGAMVIGQTIMELAAGVQLTPSELIGKSASFVIMAGVAIWLTNVLFKNISESKK